MINYVDSQKKTTGQNKLTSRSFICIVRKHKELFEKHNALANLQAFVSNNAQTIYNYKPPYKEVVLEKTPFQVTHSYGDVVPMFANETLSWSIKHVL